MSDKSNILKLYRADKKGYNTLPEKFCTDGLYTKQLNSKELMPHRKYGFKEIILNHIYTDNELGKQLYDTTPHLSFTTNPKIALKFLKGSKRLEHTKATRDDATAYIFTATFDRSELQQLEPGIYKFFFKCNYDKKLEDVNFQSFLSNFTKCNICSSEKKNVHELLLIDAETYLSDYIEEHPIQFSNASRDEEWLLMPLDPMINSTGFQSKIPIADFWDVKFYKS